MNILNYPKNYSIKLPNIEALKLAPDNYPGARNWLKVTGRLSENG
jgi:hypothetical protein